MRCRNPERFEILKQFQHKWLQSKMISLWWGHKMLTSECGGSRMVFGWCVRIYGRFVELSASDYPRRIVYCTKYSTSFGTGFHTVKEGRHLFPCTLKSFFQNGAQFGRGGKKEWVSVSIDKLGQTVLKTPISCSPPNVVVLTLWLSKCGPQKHQHHVGTYWKKQTLAWSYPKTYWIRNSWICFTVPSGRFGTHSRLWTHTVRLTSLLDPSAYFKCRNGLLTAPPNTHTYMPRTVWSHLCL